MAQATPRSRLPRLVAPLLRGLQRAILLPFTLAALFVVISLMTYSAADPAWSYADSRGEIANAGGAIGAWIADISLFFLGYAAYLIAPLLLMLGWRLRRLTLTPPALLAPVTHLFGFIIAALAGAAMATLIVPDLGSGTPALSEPLPDNAMASELGVSPLPTGAGGVIGQLLGETLLRWLDARFALILLIPLLLTGITLLIGRGWLLLMEWLGERVFVGIGLLFGAEPRPSSAEKARERLTQQIQAQLEYLDPSRSEDEVEALRLESERRRSGATPNGRADRSVTPLERSAPRSEECDGSPAASVSVPPATLEHRVSEWIEGEVIDKSASDAASRPSSGQASRPRSEPPRSGRADDDGDLIFDPDRFQWQQPTAASRSAESQQSGAPDETTTPSDASVIDRINPDLSIRRGAGEGMSDDAIEPEESSDARSGARSSKRSGRSGSSRGPSRTPSRRGLGRGLGRRGIEALAEATEKCRPEAGQSEAAVEEGAQEELSSRKHGRSTGDVRGRDPSITAPSSKASANAERSTEQQASDQDRSATSSPNAAPGTEVEIDASRSSAAATTPDSATPPWASIDSEPDSSAIDPALAAISSSEMAELDQLTPDDPAPLEDNPVQEMEVEPPAVRDGAAPPAAEMSGPASPAPQDVTAEEVVPRHLAAGSWRDAPFHRDRREDEAEAARLARLQPERVERARLEQRPDYLPPLTLLDEPPPHYASYSADALERLSREVEEALAQFGIFAEVVDVLPGPVILRFELQLAPGVKVVRVTTLIKDLARTLKVPRVRIVEVIPGKSVIGLEIPNAHREIVYLREIFESRVYVEAASPLTLALGKEINGNAVVANLAKMPHLLVAGTTGSGKSVAVNVMILSLLYRTTPEQVRMILIDPKMLELNVYEGIPHLLAPVVTDMTEAASSLRWCIAEMERRYRIMAALGVRNIAGYNRRVSEAQEKGEPLVDPLWSAEAQLDPGIELPRLERFPLIVVVVDEFADMMMVVGKKVEELIARLAQKARAAGIHLILATQRPSVDVITGLIKANIPSRIAFQVSSKVDSRTILDQMGAEQLLGYGDMLFLPPSSALPERVHGAFVDDHEVHAVVEFLKQQGAPDYVPGILEGELDALFPNEFLGSIPAPLAPRSEPGADRLYDEAVALVLESRKPSISFLQRRLKVGYNRAARMIEEMEKAGLVGPLMANGGREVLG